MPDIKNIGTSKNKFQDFIKTPSQILLGGKDRRVAVRVWTNLAKSEARLNLMQTLVKDGRGVADLENFGIGVASKFKSRKFQEQEMSKVKSRVIEPAMKVKIADEQCYQRELYHDKTRIKRQLADKISRNSRTYKKVINELRQEARKVKQEYTTKYKNKNLHLRRKYNSDKNQEDCQEPPPEDLQEFEDLIVFDKIKYNEITPDSYDITVIGDIELTSEEKSALKLHPKFCVLENLTKTNLEQEQEAAMAKLRMEITKELEQAEMSKEEIQENQEYEAESRQAYDPCEKSYDSRKRRVTDLKECARVTLPKPLGPKKKH